MLHGTFHLNGNMVEVTRNGKIPLFQIHYGFIEVLKFLIVFSYHQKKQPTDMFGTKLRRSPAQEAAIKWQIEIIGTKFFF